MLLTITSEHRPATDLGYLLHKSPFRCQSVEFGFGRVHVYYPEATEEKCTVAVLLDIDPIGLVRRRREDNSMPLEHYINDRPYVCSSYMSVAISRMFGQTLNGKCSRRPELVDVEMPLICEISALPCRGGASFLETLFEPLGYRMETRQYELSDKFKDWGGSQYYSVKLSKKTTVQELFNHLYVLIPVLDNQKHYYVDVSEIEKLLRRGEGWLSKHPERENIIRRYLRHKRSYVREALQRLMEVNPAEEDGVSRGHDNEESIERQLNLNEERLAAVVSVLQEEKVQTVIDLGCGEGKLLDRLLKDGQFTRITGMDVSIRNLESAAERLRLDSLPSMKKERVGLIHGSLLYRDGRFEGYDAATVMEVIEHLDGARLKAFEKVVFGFARPNTVVLTTPNREYNVLFENIVQGTLRHKDHRFEWTREEFRDWADRTAQRYGYVTRFVPIGREDNEAGPPTQMCIFKRNQGKGG